MGIRYWITSWGGGQPLHRSCLQPRHRAYPGRGCMGTGYPIWTTLRSVRDRHRCGDRRRGPNVEPHPAMRDCRAILGKNVHPVVRSGRPGPGGGGGNGPGRQKGLDNY
jgi:hypothetical protein